MSYIHVIIPVYNARSYLRTAIDSVLAQPYQGIDILLVDDGSTDGSSQLCDEIAAEETRVSVIHQANAGVSAARNNGIAWFLEQDAAGFLSFLDADDFWGPELLTQTLGKRIESAGDIEVFAFGHAGCDPEGNGFTVPRIYGEECTQGGRDVIWKIRGHFGANLYAVSLFRKWNIRFFEGLKYCEDKMFMMQCVFLAEKIQFMPQVLHFWRENPGSAMSRAHAISPIGYYLPIINGWIASDDFINACEDRSGRHITAGSVLAAIYFLEMAAAQFKRWGSARELADVCQQHPHYDLFLNMRRGDVSQKQYSDQQLLLHHLLLFRLKYCAIGAAERVIRLALQTGPVRRMRAKRRYRLSEIPR